MTSPGSLSRRFPENPIRIVRRSIARAGLAEPLRLCLPALCLGALLRAYLIFHHPAAYVHDDTASAMETAHSLVDRGALGIEGKKTPLVPMLYCIPAVLGIPVLPFVSVVQHLAGLVAILVGGLLVKAWFVRWRIFIVPTTVLLALQPVILWYEHAALTEFWSMLALLCVALAGWRFYRSPRPGPLAVLLLAQLFMSLARPEGNLIGLLTVALVARSSWGEHQRFVCATGVTMVWSTILLLATRTSQGGTLLLASLVHLTPHELVTSPGLAEAIRPVAVAAQAEWNSDEVPGLAAVRKDLQSAITTFLENQGMDQRTASSSVNKIAGRAGIEIALRNALALPAFAIEKFVVGHHEPPILGFNEWIIDGQREVLFSDSDEGEKMTGYTDLAWGVTLDSPDEATAYFQKSNNPLPFDGLAHFHSIWQRVSTFPIAPISLPGSNIERVPIKGLPLIYTLALLGMVALVLRDPRPLNYHLLLGLFLIGFLMIIMITANVRARFRVFFEPFWILYSLALLDCIWSAIRPPLTKPALAGRP